MLESPRQLFVSIFLAFWQRQMKKELIEKEEGEYIKDRSISIGFESPIDLGSLTIPLILDSLFLSPN